MDEAVGTGQNFHKSPKIHDLFDLAFVELTDFGFLSYILNHFDGHIRSCAVRRSDMNPAVILDVDLGAGDGHDIFHGFTTWSDNFPDLIRINGQGNNLWGPFL